MKEYNMTKYFILDTYGRLVTKLKANGPRKAVRKFFKNNTIDDMYRDGMDADEEKTFLKEGKAGIQVLPAESVHYYKLGKKNSQIKIVGEKDGHIYSQ